MQEHRSGTSSRMVKGAGIISGATLFSRIVGFARDAVIAMLLGAGIYSDVFFLAFRIPNLMRKFFSDGVLSISFVPVFSRHLIHQGRDDAFAMARSAFCLVSILSVGAVLTGMIFAPFFVQFMAPGYSSDSYQFSLAVFLSRIMMPYLTCISLMAVAMGVLNSLGHFIAPAVAPIVFNGVIILFALLIAPGIDPPVVGLAAGVTAGGIFQVAFQLPVLRKQGFRLAVRGACLAHQGALQAGRLLIPAVIGASADHVNILVGTFMASALASGSISHIYYAERLVQFPLALFAVSASIVLLPELSKMTATGAMEEAGGVFASGLELVFFITFPAMAGLMVLREPVVALLFRQGAFDAAAVAETADVLLFFSSGLWAFAGTRLFVSLYVSVSDRMIPMKAGLVSIAVNGFLGWFLMPIMGPGGIVLSVSVSAVVNFLILCAGAKTYLSARIWRKIIISACRSVFVSGIMAALVLLLLTATGVDGTSGKGVLCLTVLACVATGVGVYLLVFWAINAPETAMIRQMIWKSRA